LADLLTPNSPNHAIFDKHAERVRREEKRLTEARKHTQHWIEKFSADDTENAIAQARLLEGKITRVFSPRFWGLRKALNKAYDFGQHAIKPTWTQVLTPLQTEYKQAAEVSFELHELRDALAIENAETLYQTANELMEAHATWDDLERTVAAFPDDKLLALEATRATAIPTIQKVEQFIDLEGDLDFDSAALVTEGILESVDQLAEWLPALNSTGFPRPSSSNNCITSTSPTTPGWMPTRTSSANDAPKISAITCISAVCPPPNSSPRRNRSNAITTADAACSKTSSARRCATRPFAISPPATPVWWCGISNRSGS